MTAVEWLWDKLKNGEFINNAYELLEQALQIEEQIAFKIFKAGQDSMEEGGKSFEQYYNETIKPE